MLITRIFYECETIYRRTEYRTHMLNHALHMPMDVYGTELQGTVRSVIKQNLNNIQFLTKILCS